MTAYKQNVHRLNESLIDVLIAHPIMQRLKHIDQSGPNRYFDQHFPTFSRFEHSLGVYQLVKAAGGNIKEQAAALLHDASHSAFSHLIDLIKGLAEGELSYQDMVHLDFLRAMDIESVVNRFDISLEDLDAHKTSYTRLEQPLPNLCADRIQYILYSGWRWKRISHKTMLFVIDHLGFKENTWYFTSKKAGLIIGDLSLYFTQYLWGSAANFALYHYFSKTLLEGIQQELFTEQELEYSTDLVILEKLQKSNSPLIMNNLANCKRIDQSFCIVNTAEEHNIVYKPKCRGVDPLILNSNGILEKLTETDPSYAGRFDQLKQWCAQGTALRFLL